MENSVNDLQKLIAMTGNGHIVWLIITEENKSNKW